MNFDEWIALNFPANRGELALARKAWQVAEASTIERCAVICDAVCEDWTSSCAEGSEVMAYENRVLKDAAHAIRKLKEQP